jgi:hypothetical protein
MGLRHPRRPARNLVEALGGQAGDDVLALLVADYQQHGGQLSPVLKRPRWEPTATGTADTRDSAAMIPVVVAARA